MSYGRHPYGGVGYAGSDVADIPQADTQTALAVEWSPTTGPLDEPVWVDITGDVRNWQTSRGRNRELERFQPGRATIVLSNLSRQYDSTHTANIKPMKRIRIRETFNGVTYPVFDGFVDKWKLDYPGVGKDAVATVTATDMFKVLARTDLGLSVYDNAVLDDDPTLYYRLDETRAGPDGATLTALNKGSLGTAGSVAYIGPPLKLGDTAMVTNDPGGSIFTNQDTLGESVFLQMGLTIDDTTFDLFQSAPFVLEAWCIPIEDPPGTVLDDAALFDARNASDRLNLIYDVSASTFVAAVANDAATTYVATSAVAPRNKRHHVVLRFSLGDPLRLWVDGVLTSSAATAGTFANSLDSDLHVANAGLSPGNNNWVGNMSHASVYVGSAATAVDQAWVDRHYAAGNAPWQGDLPGARMDRVLDLALVPSTARELDDGITTLQSAEIVSQSVLEHSQKIGETEFGLLFVTRDGKVRLIGRTALFAREPGTAVYGDQVGDVGYTDFVPDDGDEVIRNIARISRLNGVLQTATDQTSVDDFGPFTYTLDGLLHQSDSYSLDYAEFIVAEYGLQKRRITSLTIGPPIVGEEDVVCPAMLGPELGDAIRVTNTPTGGGDPFEQVCAIEGIQASGSPGGVRTTRFILSPEFAVAIF